MFDAKAPNISTQADNADGDRSEPRQPDITAEAADWQQRTLLPGERFALRPTRRILLTCKSGMFRIHLGNQDGRPHWAELLEPFQFLTISPSRQIVLECVAAGSLELISLSGRSAT